MQVTFLWFIPPICCTHTFLHLLPFLIAKREQPQPFVSKVCFACSCVTRSRALLSFLSNIAPLFALSAFGFIHFGFVKVARFVPSPVATTFVTSTPASGQRTRKRCVFKFGLDSRIRIRVGSQQHNQQFEHDQMLKKEKR